MSCKQLVSVIVPCYNVEKYVEKCIQSISSQTYRYLEIIPVDDGATDKTSLILDKLAKDDQRIRVIHKRNEGVSSTRNTGLEAAKGDYVVFVDGDDYLAPDFVEYMLDMAQASGADMCISKNCFTSDQEIQVKEESLDILNPSEATALLLSPRVIVGCWNKIFKKSFIDKFQLSFLTDLYYGEGLYFITRAAQLANHVACGNKKVYYYRRNNEVSATSKYNINKYYNGEKSLDKIHNDLVLNDTGIETMFALHKSLFCLGALSQTYAHHLQEAHHEDCKHWRTIISNYLKKLLLSRKVSLYRKALLLSGYLCPGLVSKLDMWRRKRIANKSVN